MRPELRSVAASQGGVFLRRQALECGYTPDDVRRMLRIGEWRRVRHGAYAEAAVIDRLDEVGRSLLRVRAVSLVLEEPAVFSHGSAALLHGLPTYGLDLSRTRVTRSASRSGRIVAGVSHHEATLHERDIDVVDGLVCTGLVRTPLDVTREHGFEAGVVAADAALRAGADTDRMTALADVIRRWPGSRDVQPVVRFADAGSESAGESLSRIFVVSLGFPAPETQFVVRSGSFIARCDMKLRHIPLLIEFDGRIKYRRTRDACDPVIDDGDIVWAEKQREDELRALDYGMFRLIWADLFGSARQRAGQRLLRLAEKHGATPSWPRAS